MAIFGRFTQRAQRAVAAAQQAAVLLHQPYVGTEHILLGLLKEPGPVVAEVLPENVNYQSVLEQVRLLLGEGSTQNASMLELTRAAKRFWKAAFWRAAACITAMWAQSISGLRCSRRAKAWP